MAIAPRVRPESVSLVALQRLAVQFDEISDETGARYSAGAFVDWLRTEVAAYPVIDNLTHEHLRAGNLWRWRSQSGKA